MSPVSELLIAFIGILVGGIGIKAASAAFDRARARYDAAALIRQELTEEVMELRSSVSDVADRLQRWRHQYYILLLAFNELALAASSAGLPDEVINDIRGRISVRGGS